MRYENRENSDGSITVGASGNIIYLPILLFSTWGEYMDFIEYQCEFIAGAYKNKVNQMSLIKELNSIESIDSLSNNKI
jgi:hypothetical protein